MRVAIAVVALAVVSVSACTPLIGEDFDDYVERPTTCDLLLPTRADPRQHLVCADGETCATATSDGSSSTTERHCFASSDDEPPFAACRATTDCCGFRPS